MRSPTDWFRKWDRKDLTILVLGLLVVALGAVVVKHQISSAAPAAEEEAEGQGQPVSVFEVVIDRESGRSIDILFDRPVVEEIEGQILDRPPATLSPSVGGFWSWREKSVLRFEASGRLPIATEFTLSLIPVRFAAVGKRLTGEREFKVKTDQFLVERVEVNEEPALEGRKHVLFRGNIYFNYPVDPRELATRIRLIDPADAGAEPIGVDLETGWTSQVIGFRTQPLEKTPAERELELRILAELTPSGGNVSLIEDYVRPIQLGSSENLVVRAFQVMPAENESTLRVSFSSPVTPSIAAKYVILEPEVDFRLSGDGNDLLVTGAMRPGQSYKLTLGQDLPASDEAVLRASWSTDVRVPDLQPRVDFQSAGLFLSRSGMRTVALDAVNTPRANLTIERVYLNNLFYMFQYQGFPAGGSVYEGWRVGRALGNEIDTAEIDVSGERNRRVQVPLRLDELIDDAKPGLYRIAVNRPGDWQAAQRLLLLTDLGLVAKRWSDGFLIWVTSLRDLRPVAGVKIHLINDQNQTIARGATDSAGMWRVSGLRQSFESARPYMVTVERGSDFSFLLLDRMKVDTTGLDVSGAGSLASGYTAFLYGERDLYRPGESVEGVAILRDESLRAPPSMPALLRHRDPLGLERETLAVRTDGRGMAEFEMGMPDYSLTGNHTLELVIAEEVVGQYRFQVEEFVPDRIKVEIRTERDDVGPGEELAYDVRGTYLFGPPGAGLPVETRVRVEDASFQPAEFAGFDFRNDDRKVSQLELLEEEQTLDDEGRRRFAVTVPRGVDVPSALNAVIVARVSEQGGRGVTASQRVRIHPYPYYIGLRRIDEGYAEPGQSAEFEYVAVRPDGTLARATGLRAELLRDRWNTVLRHLPSGDYRYESKRESVLVDSQAISSRTERGRFRFLVPEYGSYRLVLTDTETSASTLIQFYASGWGYAPWAIENPARIELELDREEFLPGEAATVLVKAPFSGKLLLAVERDGVYHTQVHTLDGNTASLSVPILDEYRPNAYVTATLVRKVEDLEPGGVARAFGALPINVDRTSNRLDVSVTVPATVRSESELSLTVKSRPNSAVTVSAVDEGILQLIRQQTPDPFQHFYRKLALGTSSFDTYALLFPEIALDGKSPAGGGAMAAGLAQYLQTEPLRRVKPVAFWSGVVETDARGNAQVAFGLPEFQGALRVMAVASSGRRFGSTETMVRVRDPIVVTPTFPRFLSFEEEMQVPVTVRNDTGSEATIDVTLSAEGPVTVDQAPRSLTLPDGQEGTVYIAARSGTTVGEARFVVRAEGNGERTKASAQLPIRPDLPKRTEELAGAVDQASLSLEPQTQWARPDTAERTLRIGPTPLVQFSGKLDGLLRYPYGCLEQTISTVFPLLYFEDLAETLEPDLLGKEGARGSAAGFVQEGIQRVAAFRLANGAFALWHGGRDPHPWGSIYATHFLVEARRAGYAVDDYVHDGALDYLSGMVRAKPNYGSDEFERIVYSLYVMARAERPDLGVMDFLRERQLNLLRGKTKAMLAAAYTLAGNPGAVEELLAQLEQVMQVERQTGRNFSSTIRNRALMLLALLDARPEDPRIPQLVDRLARDASEVRWWTTQESAFTLLALGEFIRRQADRAPYSGTIYVGNAKLGTFGDEVVTFREIRGGESIRIEMDAGYEPHAAYYSLLTRGVPTDAGFRTESSGLEIEREYLDRDGKRADLDRVRQGDLLVVRTRARSVAGPVENVVIQNLLPAGLEVENPRLESTETLKWVADRNLDPDYVDLRDDRILLFIDLPANQWKTGYAMVRAVTPGRFRLPPVQAEAMYNGAIRATGERGAIRIDIREAP